ncbi:MAG: ThiF family adenylyltransferase [Elusimicrobia bacterium]|nr:ThiF family adenylyltransferase [Candidatus Liberimonas magnetica]
MTKSFSRNIGLISEKEQDKLQNSTVAIAGVGGVGGFPAERLARLGIGHLKIADPESFSETDINRQFGATKETIGKKKVDVIEKLVKEINPDIVVNKFGDGIKENNVNEFLKGTDLVIDAIEFFIFGPRMLLYPKARKTGKIILLSGAVGFGAPLFVFSPEGMTMEEYFNVPKDKNRLDKFQIPLNKMCPVALDYIPKELIEDIYKGKHHVPTLSPICALAGSLLAMETVFRLLGKRTGGYVPYHTYIDLYKQELIIL